MENRIIDNIGYLINLSDDELNEVLLDKKYNKANLRELVRRLLINTADLEESLMYCRDEIDSVRGMSN